MMKYYEVLVADLQFKADKPLTYSSESDLNNGYIVTVPLKNRQVTGFILNEVARPKFSTKPISAVVSTTPLPSHSVELARWMVDYYGCSLGDGLRLFAPTRPIKKVTKTVVETIETSPLENVKKLTKDQTQALSLIRSSSQTTILLHGETGSGKTEVYIELARSAIGSNRSVLFLTPEIALTPQLINYIGNRLDSTPIVIHSNMTSSVRKKHWLQILESKTPVVVVGPRSALFTPINNLGLIIVDEAHEPAYKQDQTPRYHAVRVASKLGALTGAKVILGTATPDLVDYFVADQKDAIVRMSELATFLPKDQPATEVTLVDLKDKTSFSRHGFLSDEMLSGIEQTLKNGQQVLIYLNRRGTARIILCTNCGWQMLCPNCNNSLVYHGDVHQALCHSCGFMLVPPKECPQCASSDIVYKSIGTKAVTEAMQRFFGSYKIARFDSDNKGEDKIELRYEALLHGHVDIIVGTQLVAKGFDLPKLGMVGIVIADTSLFLPDYRADERTFQLLNQVMGRVGRGHSSSRIVIQAYQTDSLAINSAIKKDWQLFYSQTLAERQTFSYPPFTFVLKLICKRATEEGAKRASKSLAKKLQTLAPDSKLSGPAPAFQSKKFGNFYYHIIIKSSNRKDLVRVARDLPAGWVADLDPTNLL